MRLNRKWLVVGCIAGTLSAPTNASVLGLADTAIFAALQAATSQNLCLAFAYDKNGNILSKTGSVAGAGGTWGVSTYGCFRWVAP